MKITNQTVAYGILYIVISSLIIFFFYLLYDVIGWKVIFVTTGIALYFLFLGLITDDIRFEFEIKNPFKKGRYLTEEEEEHFKEYLKERERR